MSTLHNIAWLLDEETSLAEIGIKTKRIKIPYPIELGEGYSEHFDIIEGITLIQDKHLFYGENRPLSVALGRFQAEFKSNQFATQIVHSGHLEIFDDEKKIKLKRTPNLDIFAKIKYFDLEQTVFTEENISVSMLIISEEKINELLGSEEAEELFKKLKIFDLFDFYEIKIPSAISNKIKNCISNSLEGNIRSLYAQSMIFQYLIEIHTYFSSTKIVSKNFRQNDYYLDDLHSALLQITTEVPTLTSLAKKYGISANKINQSFANKYGQTIYSFLSIQRLDQAYQALLSTNVPMKILAHKIGYSHVNHFITAFKKKFGVTPGSIRK